MGQRRFQKKKEKEEHGISSSSLPGMQRKLNMTKVLLGTCKPATRAFFVCSGKAGRLFLFFVFVFVSLLVVI